MRLTSSSQLLKAGPQSAVKKHRIRFETAALVFGDPYHLSTKDRVVEGELQWQTIGMVKGVQIVMVAHTISESGDEEIVRIISARKATPQERSIYAKVAKTARAKHGPAQSLTAKQKRELAAIAALPDDDIDTSDIPELPPSAWKNAVRGRFYRPIKQAVSLRLDSDVVARLKKPSKGYQTRANHILRERMLADMRKMRP